MLYRKLLLTAYNNDGGEGGDDPPPPPPPKTFTQEEVNKIMANNKREAQKKNEEMAKQLEELKKQTGLTTQQKESLEQQIEELRTSHLSEQEKLKRDKEKVENDYKVKLETKSKEAETNWTRFHNSEVKRAISDAAKEEKGYNPEQFVRHLFPDAKLVEKKDSDGNPTGEFETRVRFNDKDKDGKPITLDLTAKEVVKRMKELPEFANFFATSGTGGLGGNPPIPAGGKMDVTKMNHEQYLAQRKARKNV